MYRALTAEQSREVEQRAVAEAGVSLAELMRAAGAAVADEARQRLPEGAAVVVACGPGNNGGDGWVAARELHCSGLRVRVVALRSPEQLTGIAADAARDAIAAGVQWSVPTASPEPSEFAAEVVVDALLGTGIELPLRGDVAHWCAAINQSCAFVIAVDAPTGVDSDSGARAADAIMADCTVTFTSPKLGLMTYPGAECAGEIVVADIGIPPEFAEQVVAPEIWMADEYAALKQRILA